MSRKPSHPGPRTPTPALSLAGRAIAGSTQQTAPHFPKLAVGIQFKHVGGPGQLDYPKLRGFGSGHFLVLIDGVKVAEGLSPGVGHPLWPL
jgi:outer membrane cobalamin receptor